MRFDRTIHLGNVISWIVLIIGFAVGYARLEGDVTRSKDDIKEMRPKVINYDRDIEVIKVRLTSIDEKLDQIARSRP